MRYTNPRLLYFTLLYRTITENVLPNDNVSMSVGHLDHVWIVYSSMEHVTWKSFPCHVLHRAVNNQDVRRISKRCHYVTHFQLCKVRSFYVIDRTNWMNLFNTNSLPDCLWLAVSERLCQVFEVVLDNQTKHLCVFGLHGTIWILNIFCLYPSHSDP